jgi:hypothetical protein
MLLELGRDEPPKKKIVRSVIVETMVYPDEATLRLRFVVHWKGGTHTEFEMDKTRSGAGRRTSMDDQELIRRMASTGTTRSPEL